MFPRLARGLVVITGMVMLLALGLTAGPARSDSAGGEETPTILEVLTAVDPQERIDAQGRQQKEDAGQQKEDAGKGQEAAAAAAAAQFDAQGKRREGAKDVGVQAATSQACLTLHNGPGVTFQIRVTFNPNTYPYPVTGGTISGSICGSPNWAVTGGSIGNSLVINARRTSGGADCANTVTIVGNFRNPSSYAGTYGFNGSSTPFPHATLFSYGACP
jgi:hypothetical protein